MNNSRLLACPPPREDFDIARDWELSEKEAFTLAEVLITLGVVGVVAAMTMPSLISNIQATINKNKFKKALNTLNQAVTMAYAKEEINFANTNIPCQGQIKNTLPNGSVSTAYVDTTKSALGGPDNSFCSIFNSTIDNVKYLGQVEYPWNLFEVERHDSSLGNYIAYQLKDGAIFAFDKTTTNCIKDKNAIPKIDSGGSLSGAYSSSSTTIYPKCHGFIDINGYKKPNKLVNVNGNAYRANSSDKIEVTDIFPIVFYDGVVAPGTEPVRKLLETK